jgi:hypothetical protein
MRLNKKMLVVFVVLIGASFIITGVSILVNQTALDSAPAEAQLSGDWSSTGVLSFDSKTGAPSNFAEIAITIGEDGSVSGSVGNAQLVGCRLKKNRTGFEKSFNIKTDYIILGGTLDGPIYAGDSVAERNVTIPLNLENQLLIGTLFHIETLKYPDPIISKLEFTKIEDEHQE